MACTFECCLTNHISANSWESMVYTAVMMYSQSHLTELSWHSTVALSRQPKLQSYKFSWIKIDQLMSLALLFHCVLFNMFRMLVHPSSGACDLLWKHCFSLHKDTTPPQPNHTVTPTHIEPEQYNTWNKFTVSHKLLRMDVLTFETCWTVNSEIIKLVTSSWSLFIQISRWCTVQ